MGEIFLGLGANGERQVLQLSRANRHGLVAGATGTGKTVTLQGLAESFSAEGVPAGGGGIFTPACRAFERPIAIACLADLAPCLPSRM